MKIIILLFALVFGVGAAGKKTAYEVKQTTARHELNSLKSYPNVLPVVEIVSTRF